MALTDPAGYSKQQWARVNEMALMCDVAAVDDHRGGLNRSQSTWANSYATDEERWADSRKHRFADSTMPGAEAVEQFYAERNARDAFAQPQPSVLGAWFGRG